MKLPERDAIAAGLVGFSPALCRGLIEATVKQRLPQ